ncbi:MAG: phosphate propanoyltransferase [bacterium]
MNKIKVKIEVSAKHLHISREDLDVLFGKDYELKKKKDLSQTGEFASEEKVDLINGDKKLEGIRIVGPIRKKTQIELAITDAIKLGIKPPLRISGNTENSETVKVVGPKGTLELKEGVIIAKRHLHISTAEAENYGLKNNQVVKLKILGERKLVFDEIVVRIADNYKFMIHLDTDEANAAHISNMDEGEIII